MSASWIVKFGMVVLTAAFKLRLPLEWVIRKTLFRQFVGGETIEDCGETIKRLSDFGIGTILDVAVEGKQTDAAFEATHREILKTIALAKFNPSIPFCVFKVTGIANLRLENKSRAEERVQDICEAAHRSQVRIFIDAEETWFQNTIDRLATQAMERFNRDRAIVYNTVQMYRTDGMELLERSIEEARRKSYFLGVKLVRGAYMEKERKHAEHQGRPSPILPDKEACDRSFDRALEQLMNVLDRVSLCAGTHNEQSTLLLTELMKKHGISPKDPRVYFAQLYGMGDFLSYNLADEGYNVAKYVPYGPVREVIPYLVRRAQENTSVGGQSNRELVLISNEIRRRSVAR